MLSDVEWLWLGIAAAFLAAVLRRYWLWQRQARPRRPDLRVEQAWRLWLAGTARHPDAALMPPGFDPGSIPEQVRDVIRTRLLETERRSLAEASPRTAVRRAILESASLGLHLEAILELEDCDREALLEGYQSGMEGLLPQAMQISFAQWCVLRLYGQLKYDDAVPKDWLHHFVLIGRPYIREKVRLARDSVLRLDSGARRIVQIYDELLEELIGELLSAAPKKKFVPPDLPHAPVPRARGG